MHKIHKVINLLSAGVGLVKAVALSDFRPATSGLTSTCNRVYTAQIQGCQTSDFQGGNGCSNICIQGLLLINTEVATACQNANVASSSIIGIFLAGKGIRALCNIEVVTTTLSNTSAPAPTSATTPPPAKTSINPVPISPGTLSTQQVSSARSTMTVSSPLPPESSVTSIMSIPLKSSATISPTSPTPTTAAASQVAGQVPLPKCSNPGNGQGGSPFDQVPGRDCINAGLPLQISVLLSLACLLGPVAVQQLI